MNYNPIILALDYNNFAEADRMLYTVRSHIGMIKVGLELYSSVGRDVFQLSKEYNIPVFLDLKLCDTPTTVRKTVESLMGSLATLPGNHFLSVHCFGGREMLQTACEVCDNTNVKLVGITLLTSLDSDDLDDFGFSNRSVGTKTVCLTRMGRGCIDVGVEDQPGYPATRWAPATPPIPGRDPIGLDTFVCAPAQLALMRKHFKDKITLISPGIRQEGTESHDHKSAKTASFAFHGGANWIVVGRPITQASDPTSAARYFEKVAEKY